MFGKLFIYLFLLVFNIYSVFDYFERKIYLSAAIFSILTLLNIYLLITALGDDLM